MMARCLNRVREAKKPHLGPHKKMSDKVTRNAFWGSQYLLSAKKRVCWMKRCNLRNRSLKLSSRRLIASDFTPRSSGVWRGRRLLT